MQAYWYRPHTGGGDLTLWSTGWTLEDVVDNDVTEMWNLRQPTRIQQAEAMVTHWEEWSRDH